MGRWLHAHTSHVSELRVRLQRRDDIVWKKMNSSQAGVILGRINVIGGISSLGEASKCIQYFDEDKGAWVDSENTLWETHSLDSHQVNSLHLTRSQKSPADVGRFGLSMKVPYNCSCWEQYIVLAGMCKQYIWGINWFVRIFEVVTCSNRGKRTKCRLPCSPPLP